MKMCVVQENGLNESLALTELSAYLRTDGHNIALFIEREERSLEKSIASFAPDILLVPGDIGGHGWFHRMLSRLKRASPIPIVVGGTYPTFYPDDAFADPNVDYLILGEAETPARRLLEALQGGGDPSGIPGVWGRYRGGGFKNPIGPPLRNLDDLPIPDRALYYKYGFIRDFTL